MRRIGVILSNGSDLAGDELDGIILTLLAIERVGATAIFFVPDGAQQTVKNRINREDPAGIRTVLMTSLYLAFQKATPIDYADLSQIDALVLPGVQMMKKNPDGFIFVDKNTAINRNIEKLTREIYKQGKPIGFIGLAAMLVPEVVESPVRLTIGTDSILAETMEERGAIHVPCPPDDIVEDAEHNIITTPAGVEACTLSESAQGIDKLIKHLTDMIE